MKLFVVGANGRVGTEVVQQALEAGHEVTAFVRDPSQLTSRPRLNIVKGDVTANADALESHDAVVSALGNPLWLRGLKGPAIMERSFRVLVDSMKRHGVRRIVAPIAWGTGASRKPAGLLVQLVAATLIRRDYRDFDAAESVLAESGLEWTLAYFGSLSDGARTNRWSASPDIETPSKLRIARADVADFLVRAAQSRQPQRVVLSGAP